MSRDSDSHQRLWLSLGHGGKRARQPTWRWWQDKDNPKIWTISAPNGLAEFTQIGRTVSYQGKEIITSKTQWAATWQTVAYFYEIVVPSLPHPSKSSDAA